MALPIVLHAFKNRRTGFDCRIFAKALGIVSPQIYFPITQLLQDRGALVIRTKGDPASLASAVVNQIRTQDPKEEHSLWTLE